MSKLTWLDGTLMKRDTYPNSFVTCADQVRYHIRFLLTEDESTPRLSLTRPLAHAALITWSLCPNFTVLVADRVSYRIRFPMVEGGTMLWSSYASSHPT